MALSVNFATKKKLRSINYNDLIKLNDIFFFKKSNNKKCFII